MAHPIHSEFLLDPSVVYLNHGSYGACPRAVFETYQAWQRELEMNPVDFVGHRLSGLLAESRARLAAYLGVTADDVVYFANPTTAVKMICRGLPLNPGDEILTTNYEYPAMDATWDLDVYKVGARYIHQTVPLPIPSSDDFVEALWSGVTERTRIIFLSHIAAFSALIFPVEEICRRARQAGIITFVDGAHAPSQIPLDLKDMDVDIYIGACHKWLCAPKGAGFAYVHPRLHGWLATPYAESRGRSVEQIKEWWGESQFVATFQGQGTRDPSAFLSVPAAIDFQARHDWDDHRRRCHALASQTRQRVNALTGMEPLSPDSAEFFGQMVSASIPEAYAASVRAALHERHIVTVVIHAGDRLVLRASFQAHNDQQDADCLLEAVATGLSKRQT